MYDSVIVGAGPAGLSAGLFGKMRGLDILVLEAEKAGGQLVTLYPRKIVHNYPSYQAVLADELAKRMLAHTESLGVEIREEERVEGARPNRNGFVIDSSKGSYEAKSVIVAMGFGIFKPRKLGVPGEDNFSGRGVEYKMPKVREAEGKRVVVVGGGDSAVDIALSLKDIADVTLVNRSERFVAHQTSAEALEASPVKVLLQSQIKEIHGNGGVGEVIITRDGRPAALRADLVVVAAGLMPNLGALKEWGLEMAGQFLKVTPDMATSREGFFACGDVVNYPGKVKLLVTACGEGATAASSAYAFLKKKHK
ncbi:MAG: NAD(P)/FAD-dependent oxidoreductase [Chloroflexi bacterium]|nr:NAD(P)/FAD-dependent oxidoreductase [Chloroflexota bacterium]